MSTWDRNTPGSAAADCQEGDSGMHEAAPELSVSGHGQLELKVRQSKQPGKDKLSTGKDQQRGHGCCC